MSILEPPGPDLLKLPVTRPVSDQVRTSEPGPGPFPGIRKPFRSLWWLVHISFGAICLILILAVFAAIPGLNLLTLGYMLDGQRRVALSGRLRDGFPLMKLAPRLGVVAIFTLLFLIPVRLLSTMCNAALIVRGGTDVSSDGLLLGLTILKTVTAMHLILAIMNGGTVGCFLRPIRNVRRIGKALVDRTFASERQHWIVEVWGILRPAYHFMLGLKAVLGAFLWLAIPTSLLVAYSAPGRVAPGFAVLSFLGGLLLVLVAGWLPALQVQQAVSGRFMDIFRLRIARSMIRNSPVAWLFASVVLYAMTLPLYLAKIRLLPSDAFLVLTPVFIVAIYPSRILIAKAFHRSQSREQSAGFGFRWIARLLAFPLLALYVLFLFLTPTISELGRAAPLENHAFMSPVPYGQWGK
ncbi:MAG: hypothetical protein KDA91_02655 [Planctomycetaceae bacterium]|nr:hypothetical protein [Planctomycetaceae bacterium]